MNEKIAASPIFPASWAWRFKSPEAFVTGTVQAGDLREAIAGIMTSQGKGGRVFHETYTVDRGTFTLRVSSAPADSTD